MKNSSTDSSTVSQASFVQSVVDTSKNAADSSSTPRNELHEQRTLEGTFAFALLRTSNKKTKKKPVQNEMNKCRRSRGHPVCLSFVPPIAALSRVSVKIWPTRPGTRAEKRASRVQRSQVRVAPNFLRRDVARVANLQRSPSERARCRKNEVTLCKLNRVNSVLALGSR